MVIVAIVAASSLYAQQQSVAGAWTLSAGGMSLRLVLEQKGKDITGTLETPHGTVPLKGEFAGGQIKFSGTSDEIQLSATGTVKSDGSLAGSLTSHAGDMEWTAVRTVAK
jgi:hypothetical protein